MIHLPRFQKIKESSLYFLRIAAEHLFLASLVLIFISLLLGSAAFYKYNILPQGIAPELITGSVKFEEDIYQKIIERWQSRRERFDIAGTKEYSDIFK